MINWVIGCILREENGPLFQVQRKAAAIDGSYQIRNSPIASDCIQLHGIKHLNIITGLALSICGSLSPVSTPWRWSLLHNDSAEWSQAPSDSHYSVKQHYIVRLTKYLPALCPRVPVCLLQHSILCFSGSWEQHRLTLSLRHLLAPCIWPQDVRMLLPREENCSNSLRPRPMKWPRKINQDSSFDWNTEILTANDRGGVRLICWVMVANWLQLPGPAQFPIGQAPLSDTIIGSQGTSDTSQQVIASGF